MRNTTSSTSLGACEVKRSTQVDSYLSDTNRALAELEEALAAHANAISPVLRGALPPPANEKCQPDEALCPVADKLRTISRTIHRLRGGLQDLTERTEA